jgi:hypothetical protein
MQRKIALCMTGLGLLTLTACNSGTSTSAPNTQTTPGTLLYSPPFRVASLTAAQLTAQLGANTTGQQLLALAGTPKCGIDFHLIKYATTGGAGEATHASGVIMAPTGGTGCSGARPILEYAHGTTAMSSYNLANITDSTNDAWTESVMLAAFYAAQGYIVVAPNYVGYDVQDVDTLSYHPYLNAAQQSGEMIDALTAARSALTAGLPSGDTDGGKLFVTGYSQGGHVAMATVRAMQSKGIAVTASAPMSGPYAMLAFGDAVVAYSQVGLGGTIYYPMVINSYQHAYGNIYSSASSFYSATYATGIDALLPGTLSVTQLFTQNKLPEFAIFNSTTPGTGSEPGSGIPALDAAMGVPSNPLFALGFGNPYLIQNSVRVSYALDAAVHPDGALPVPQAGVPVSASPAYPLRVALKTNDLRTNWSPSAPMLMCGGHGDPDVFYSVNTQTMQAYWGANAPAAPVQAIDVDPSSSTPLATQIGTIAATVMATNPGASAATLTTALQTAIVTAFASNFTASGVPNSPQGVQIAGAAGVAAQAMALYLSQGVTNPVTMATDVGNAIVAYYHFPLTQLSCEVAAQGFFAQF